MRVGRLRHRITIEQLSTEAGVMTEPPAYGAITEPPADGAYVSAGGQNQYGEPNAEWVTFLTAYASIDPLVGREYMAAKQVQSEATHKIRMRYRAGITTTMRVKCGDRDFDIVSLLNIEERKRELLIMATEDV
jgi:SPP1 family predicted phage head-tail adaptor